MDVVRHFLATELEQLFYFPLWTAAFVFHTIKNKGCGFGRTITATANAECAVKDGRDNDLHIWGDKEWNDQQCVY